MAKKSTRDYGKPRQKFDEGGAVEFDPNAQGRAGSRGIFQDSPWGPENKWWMHKEPYPKQQEVSPADSKDRNRMDPEDFVNPEDPKTKARIQRDA